MLYWLSVTRVLVARIASRHRRPWPAPGAWLGLMLLLAACGGSSTPAATDPGGSAPSTAADSAGAAYPAAESWPSAPGADPSGAAASLCGLIDPTTISLNNQGLPYEWQASCGAATALLPTHIRIDFLSLGDVAAASHGRPPVIYLIPAGAYGQQADAAGYPLVDERLRALRAMMAGQATLSAGGLPVLPLEMSAAANEPAIAMSRLDPGHSAGIRFIGRLDGDTGPLLADDLSYVYLGLAGANDDVLVSFVYPVSTAHLPATPEAVDAADRAEANSAPAAYLSRTTGLLNALAGDEWSPTLQSLDALISSLEFGGRETGGPPPLYSPPQPSQPSQTFAVVTAPQGALLYDGPHGCYGVVGLATAGTSLLISGRSADGAWWQTPVAGTPEGWGWLRAANARGYGTSIVGLAAAPARQPDCGRPGDLSAARPAELLSPGVAPAYPPPAAAPYPSPADPYPALPVPEELPAAYSGARPRITAWADRATIARGECATLRWTVLDAQQVTLGPPGAAAGPDGARLVCPAAAAVYELRVVGNDGLVDVVPLPVSVLPGNELAGSRWVLLAFGGDERLPVATTPVVTFGQGAYLRGSGGCNTFHGSYAAGGGALSVAIEGRSTASCGGDAAAQEARLLDALANARSYWLADGQLLLYGADGGLSLRFGR